MKNSTVTAAVRENTISAICLFLPCPSAVALSPVKPVAFPASVDDYGGADRQRPVESFEIVTGDPVDRLARAVEERGSDEVIILTRPHLVAELFHTDWTHQARRRLGVPLLHMLAHRDSI